MVSHDLATEERVFIQFPPLMEDEHCSSSKGAAQVGCGETTIKDKTVTKDNKKRTQANDNESLMIGRGLAMITPPETGSENEWFLL